MGCGVCSSDTGGGAPAGCKNNGGCMTGGCNKLNSFDWLGNMSLPGIDPFEIVEVRFKGGRKGFYRNINRLFLSSGDPVVVEAQTGHHVGFVAIQGELVRLQMRKKKVKEDDELPIIYRIATERDLERLVETRKRELPTMYRTRQIVKEIGLDMKLSDVEYQADNTKATFYYSADERVDFRELIKVLASEFKIRVEMRQISLRQEASRIGGIGSCGRELCCSTWLTEFQSVSTGAARYQNLSLNPNKLSGQCGRLKCCLNYELETYQDALLDIPKVDKPLLIERGEATLQKVDIFKKQLWFSFENDSNWYPVTAKRVIQIMEMNEQGKKAETLEEVIIPEIEKPKKGNKNKSSSRRSAKKNTTSVKAEAKKGQQKSSNTRTEKQKDINAKDASSQKAVSKQRNQKAPQQKATSGQQKQGPNQQKAGGGQQKQTGQQAKQNRGNNANRQKGKAVVKPNQGNQDRRGNPRGKKKVNNQNAPKKNVKSANQNDQVNNPPTNNGDKPKRPFKRRRNNNRKKTPPKKEE
ncbi:MAG: PSP1 domain-containing protein [Flammeovirgaceae bacterium]